MNAAPLTVPVTLSPGHFQSPVFKAHVSTQHVVSIAFDSSLPSTEMNCLIGMKLSLNECGDIPEALSVKWRLVSSNQTLASGSSSDRGASYSYNLIERHIGRFVAQRGTEYTLDFDVLQDGSRLAPAHPVLKVEPNLNGYEGWLMLAWFAFYGGLVCAIVGAIVTYGTVFGA